MGYGSRWLIGVVGLTATLVLSSPKGLMGQASASVGTVEEVVDLVSGEDPGPTDRALMSRTGTTTWTQLVEDSELIGELEMKVLSLLNLRVEVNSDGNEGRLIFTTDLKHEQSPGARVFPDQSVDSSLYVVRQGFRGPEVDIEEGTLVVEWDRGVVTVTAAGQVIPIEGTSAAFHVFPGGDSAYVYLGEGTLTFQSSGSQAADRSLYVVRRPPAALPIELRNGGVGADHLAAWHDALDLHGQHVWASPGLLGIGWPWWAAGALGGACAATECWDVLIGGSKTVLIELRLPF